MIHHVTEIPKRPTLPPQTHKGEYGKILVVGGSPQYYGAPILTALGAECAGSDLITLCLPKEHVEAAKNYSLNFFLKPFQGATLSLKDVLEIIKYSQDVHVMVLGNGIGNTSSTKKAVLKILKHIAIPIILDAQALFPEILTIQTNFKKDWILTPHKTEFERLFQCEFSIENLIAQTQKYDFTILTKGQIDHIANKNKLYSNRTGCVQMRVGGTGDVLAGITACYRSQGIDSFAAASSAAYYFGRTGEALAQKKQSFSAHELTKLFSVS